VHPREFGRGSEHPAGDTDLVDQEPYEALAVLEGQRLGAVCRTRRVKDSTLRVNLLLTASSRRWLSSVSRSSCSSR
jgi:hypothetical protein